MHSTHCLLAVTAVFMAFHLLAIGTPPVEDGMYLPLNSTPMDIRVSPLDGSIVVSAGPDILRLDIDFTLNGTVTTHDHQPGHRIALSHNTTDTILVCKDSFCTHYYVDWELEELYLSTKVARGFDSVPLSVDPEGFYIGTSDGRSINIKHFDVEDNTEREYDWAFTNNTFNQRKFLQGFQYGGFVYFIVQDNGTSLIANNVRIIRVCHDLDSTSFDAAYEAVLECGKVSPGSKVEVSNSILNGNNFTITISITTDDDTNICSFSINDINSEMDASYDLCSSRDSSDLKIPLVWYNERTCGVFSEAVDDMCDFDLANHVHAIPALATFNSVPGQRLLQFNDSEEISAILSIQVGNSIDLLFVAYSTTDENHFLEKYYVDSDGTLESVSREEHSLRIILLRWNEVMEEMYAANADSVFLVPLERCSDYTTCDECTRSNDPLCGWCPLEQYCSRDIYCHRSSDIGHWVNGPNQCIASVSLATDTMDVDVIQKVELTINPQEAVLPSSPTQGYQCGFHHRSHGNVSYEFTAPFSEGACQLPEAQISDFEGKLIELNFTLQVPNMLNISSSSFLTLHNCSLHTDCRACVEASMACGWCVHDRICTGNSSLCRQEDDWRSLQVEGSTSVCPMVVTPDHNTYSLPVAVQRELQLSTVNIPPEIPGHRYGCVLKYKTGSVIELQPHYDSETQFRCLVSESQVYLSSDVANGTEATELELLWIRSSDNYSVPVHTVKVTLYNCLELGRDCSSCLSANIGTGFECIWCDRQQREDECTVIDYCQTEATAAVEISGCPLPLITSVSPKSGPTLGGTVVTVNGSNLGAEASDVTVKLINSDTLKTTSCLVDGTKYIPGTQIVCTTQEASEGDYKVTVRVQRGDEIAEPLLSDQIFTYAHPIVNSIEPMQGPKAGGTKIMILGSNLDISSPGIVNVFIGDIECDVQSVFSNMIVCVSRSVQQASTRQRIRIHIDNADMPSEQFTYSENPIFTEVNPQNIIPAGGVTLSFRGNYLDVVLHPELIMKINNHTLRSPCKPKSSKLLKCSTPRFPDEVSINFQQTKRSLDILNYTIAMDGASGPESSHKDLQLGVRPNPVFSSLNDKEYTLNSKQTISINGWNIDSVLTSELAVMIEDVACEIADVTTTQVRCYPPDTIAAGDRHIKVFVGQNGLNYSVGLLRYKPAQSGSSNNHLLLVIIPALAGVIVLMLTVLAVLCCSVGLLIHKRRKYKAKQRKLFNDPDSSNVSTMRNAYNGNGHHEYDTIPDVLEQMQLQRMEMITCASHSGIPLNDISSTRQNHNIYYSEDEGRGSSASSNNFSSTNSSNTSGSRPLSTSTTGSVSVKSVQRPQLPPLPTSMSDEYIAMRSASDASLKNDARLSAYKSKLAAATTVATAALQELTVTDEQKKGPVEGYENVKEMTDKPAVKLAEHKSRESSA